MLTIESISEHDAGYGSYPILEGVDETGRAVAVHAFREVLQGELANSPLSIGDTLVITYGGKHPERKYHRYKVRRPDGSAPGVDWSKYGEPQRQERPPSHVPTGEPPEDPKGDDDEIPF